jgi:uncharacterized protein YndB with AHSA1/START domain
MPICEVDLQIGGKYRYVWRNDANGEEFGVHGEFREVERPHRLVQRESMCGVSGEALCTAVFAEFGTGTRFTLTMLFDSQEARDGALASGMVEGMSMSYDRMQDVIVKQAVS